MPAPLTDRDRTTPPIPTWMWLADAVILLLLAAAAWIALFGGALWSIGPLTFSLRSPGRLTLVALALVAVTWAAQPHVSPKRRWQRRLERFTSRFPIAATVLPIALGTRFAILIAGLVAVKLIGLPPPVTGREWQSIWPDDLVNLPWRWDTGWFTGIAIDGYTWDPDPTHEQSIVFFPGFPMLMRMGAMLVAHPHSPVAVVWSGVVVSWSAFALACAYLYKLTREEFGEDVATAAVLFLAAYPFAAFYSTAYSEGLFLFVVIATFYHFRRQEFTLAALFGLATGLSRLNGCILSVILAAVLVLQEWSPAIKPAAQAPPSLPEPPLPEPPLPQSLSRSPRPPLQPRALQSLPSLLRRLTSPESLRAWLVAAMPGIGMLIYSAFIWKLTGDPFAWMKRQAAWHRDIHLFDPRLAAQFQQPRYWLDTAALVLSLASMWPIAKRLGYAAALFVALTTLLPFLNGGLLSIGRFTSIVFPLFIWLALAVPASQRALALTIFGIGQSLVACVFFTNRLLY